MKRDYVCYKDEGLRLAEVYQFSILTKSTIRQALGSKDWSAAL